MVSDSLQQIANHFGIEKGNGQLHQFDQVIVYAAKRGLTLTLFLIGAGLTRNALKTVSFRPMVLGVLLWVLISISSLVVILHIIS